MSILQIYPHASVRLGECTASSKRCRRACSGPERISEGYTALPFNTQFSRESPEAIPAKIRARVAMVSVACHLYPRSGTSPTKEFTIKTRSLSNLKLCIFKHPYGLPMSAVIQSIASRMKTQCKPRPWWRLDLSRCSSDPPVRNWKRPSVWPPGS